MFTVAATRAVRRVHRRAVADAARAWPWPRIAILRPCEGLDPGLHENLLSSVTARYDGEREVFLLVPSTTDPGHAVAEAVRAEAPPGVRVEVVVTGIETRANRKVAQLRSAEPRSEAPVVVVADSDIRLDDATLPSLLAVLEADPRAGASSAPMREVCPVTLGDRASSALLSSTPHAFLCLAGLAERTGGAHFLCGALVAIRRTVLAEVGGFVALEPYLGEDFELARRLHAAGYTIPHAAAPARVTDHGRSLPFVLRRQARWCTVTRMQRPRLFCTFVLLLGCTPLILTLAALALLLKAPFAPFAAALTAGYLLTRVIFASLLRAAYGLGASPLRALPALLLGESLLLAAAVLALGRPHVVWRGRRYRVGPGGLMGDGIK